MIRVLDISETWVGGQLRHRALVEADSGEAAKALLAMVEDHNAIENDTENGTVHDLVQGAHAAREAEAQAAVQQQKAADDAAALAAIHAAGETTITPATALGQTSIAPAPAVAASPAELAHPEGAPTP